MAALALPRRPQPTAPFPAISTDAATIAPIAPGITLGTYAMETAAGPLRIRVIAADPHNPMVRVRTALADETLISPGETLSSMAQRSGAVAGINGDYFDIEQTNQPQNVLVRNGVLDRTPDARWAFAVTKDGDPIFAQFSVDASLTLPDGSAMPLPHVNSSWPPVDLDLITPVFGPLPPRPGDTLFALEPVDGTPPFATYRIAAALDAAIAQPPGTYLLANAAQTAVDALQAGATIAVTQQSLPDLSTIAAAIGGGPLLVRDGAWYADPQGPSKGEFATQMPASAIGERADGTLLLVQVDGRQPDRSVGLLQPQLAQLLIAFGAQEGMQLDGGGSSTIVARLPGASLATVLNRPSDGSERRIADALLIASDAPFGPASRLVASPQALRLYPGARERIAIGATDAWGHAATMRPASFTVEPANLGEVIDGVFTARDPGNGIVRVRAGALQIDVPVTVTEQVASVRIRPLDPTVLPHGSLQLVVDAYDGQGYPIALPRRLAWSATSGAIDALGRFTAADGDAAVHLALGKRTFDGEITVGEHTVPLDLRVPAMHFATAPAGQAGSLSPAQQCAGCLKLQYDFTGKERAAYLDTAVALPPRALALRLRVLGDGSGAILRIALVNAIHERFLYTLARDDWKGWRTLRFAIPRALAKPVTLAALYAIDRVGPAPAVRASGALTFGAIDAEVAGRGRKPSK